MKSVLKENEVVMLVATVLGLYDLFTIPFNSFLIASLFAAVIFHLTKSLFLVAFVYFIPQIIRISNILIINNKDSFKNRQEIITENIKHMEAKEEIKEEEAEKAKTPTVEYFNSPNEISKRINDFKKNSPQAKELEVSGFVDIEGTSSYPNFIKESFIGSPSDKNTRIETVPEEDVPRSGTIENKLKPTVSVEPFDDESVNRALQRNANSSALHSSNIKSL
jgi:hypothetical protein